MNSPDAVINRRILIVDDSESIHEDFRKCILGPRSADCQALQEATETLFGEPPQAVASPGEYELDSAYQGEEALGLVQDAVEQRRPYAVAFVDVRMPPGWDGIETIERLWKVDPDLQAVICTAYSDVSMAQIVQRLGKTDRLLILKKPFDPMEVLLLATALTRKWQAVGQARQKLRELQEWLLDAERVMDVIRTSHEELELANDDVRSRAANLTQLVRQRTAEAVATRDVAVFALARLAESRDPETAGHLERMRAYSQVLAEWLAENGPYTEQIDEQFLEDLYRSSPLHDVGKVGVPDEILLKPDALTPQQFEVMKTHTVIGWEALRQAAEQSDYGDFLDMAAEVALRHHERFDGTGYPGRLAGQEIPLAARIVAVADEFDALTSVRVYKDAVDPAIATRQIEDGDGTHFDPAVVEAFRACGDEFGEILAGNDVAERAFSGGADVSAPVTCSTQDPATSID